VSLGSDHAINRHEGDCVEQLYQLTGGYGADHVLEIVVGPHLGQALKAVAINGRISVIGVLEGFEVSGPAVPLLLKAPVVQGICRRHSACRSPASDR
ncbi:zinc-binding dehydrogenase, partial [Rhizobium johnstonii]